MSDGGPTDTGANDAPPVLDDRYEVLRPIARGGMADVYLGRDRLLDRPVAVKVLFPEFSSDPSFVERFRRNRASNGRCLAVVGHLRRWLQGRFYTNDCS
jgi:serine/threonine protein kinase